MNTFPSLFALIHGKSPAANQIVQHMQASLQPYGTNHMGGGGSGGGEGGREGDGKRIDVARKNSCRVMSVWMFPSPLFLFLSLSHSLSHLWYHFLCTEYSCRPLNAQRKADLSNPRRTKYHE